MQHRRNIWFHIEVKNKTLDEAFIFFSKCFASNKSELQRCSNNAVTVLITWKPL